MENFKEVINNIQNDFFYLKKEIDLLKSEINQTNDRMLDFSKIIENLYKEVKEISSHNQKELKSNRQFNTQTDNLNFQTNKQTIQTDKSFFKPLNTQILGISNGNKGVSTDRQTDQQTDRQTLIKQKEVFSEKINDADNLLESLDNIKKELRLKFKNLTDQELIVFSTIYQLEEEKGYSDYKSLSSRLNLSESSIRDYVRRLLKKSIPLEKIKINNKEIRIKISNNLKKIASLDSLLKLRSL